MGHEILMSQRRCLFYDNHNVRKLFMFAIKPLRPLAAVLDRRSQKP